MCQSSDLRTRIFLPDSPALVDEKYRLLVVRRLVNTYVLASEGPEEFLT